MTFDRYLLAAAIAGVLSAFAGTSLAADQPAEKPIVKGEPIYGYRLMSPEERDEYRMKMRNARSAEDRQAIREKHHAAMVERAKERGVTLPDSPPAGGGRGAGMGRGRGMGPGGGMGPGPGMGPGGGRQ